MEEYVILVDSSDRQIGQQEKIETHRMGLLHRAFSIFVFNSVGALLLQRRNPRKYHCGNLWSNTCCSHPRPGETLQKAIHRRLIEEMGFDCELIFLGSFIYRIHFDNGLIENEFDHIYYGIYDGEPVANDGEVSDYKWIELPRLHEDLKSSPEKYTPWLVPALSVFSRQWLESVDFETE